jgi:hypothetical protein
MEQRHVGAQQDVVELCFLGRMPVRPLKILATTANCARSFLVCRPHTRNSEVGRWMKGRYSSTEINRDQQRERERERELKRSSEREMGERELG